jgi:undecaprenyl pyrophosphate phosphatase UppP
MFAIIALILAVIVGLIVLSAVMHLLFSPWLILAAIAVLVWIKFRPRRTHE